MKSKTVNAKGARKVYLEILIILLVVRLPASAQKLYVSPETKLITCDTVMNIAGKPADQLFDKTKAWFTEYFREAKEVIRGENKPSMIKGSFSLTRNLGLGVKQTWISDVTVRIKDGAVKIVINGIRGETGFGVESNWVKQDGALRTASSYSKPMEFLQENYKNLFLNLRAYMDKNDDF